MAAEVIAFDSGKQASYVKAVKKIKKTIASEAKQKELDGGHKRGIILISHLPHGFYENELSGFFGQFGNVTRVRVARSKKTGRSKGYAFVEFEFEEVAQIAAESMNNYLMYERLVKCEVLTGKIHARKIFSGEDYGKNNFPKLGNRNQLKQKLERPQTKEELQKVLQARLANVEKRNKKLAELGINYEFKPKGFQLPGSSSKHTKQAEAMEDDDEDDSDLEIELELFEKKTDKIPTPNPSPAPPKAKTPPAKLKFSPKLLRSRTGKTGGAEQQPPTPTPTPKKQRMSLGAHIPMEISKTPKTPIAGSASAKLTKKQQRMSCNVPMSIGTGKSPATPAAKKKVPAAVSTPAAGKVATPAKKTPKPTPKAAPTPKKQNKRMSCTVPAGVAVNKATTPKTTEKPKFSPKLLRSRAKETGVAPLHPKGLPPKAPRRKSTV